LLFCPSRGSADLGIKLLPIVLRYFVGGVDNFNPSVVKKAYCRLVALMDYFNELLPLVQPTNELVRRIFNAFHDFYPPFFYSRKEIFDFAKIF
jgi:hypothetical protein